MGERHYRQKYSRALEKRIDYEEGYEETTYDWDMCDEISIANGHEIDFYEYWNHPSFVDEE